MAGFLLLPIVLDMVLQSRGIIAELQKTFELYGKAFSVSGAMGVQCVEICVRNVFFYGELGDIFESVFTILPIINQISKTTFQPVIMNCSKYNSS